MHSYLVKTDHCTRSPTTLSTPALTDQQLLWPQLRETQSYNVSLMKVKSTNRASPHVYTVESYMYSPCTTWSLIQELRSTCTVNGALRAPSLWVSVCATAALSSQCWSKIVCILFLFWPQVEKQWMLCQGEWQRAPYVPIALLQTLLEPTTVAGTYPITKYFNNYSNMYISFVEILECI